MALEAPRSGERPLLLDSEEYKEFASPGRLESLSLKD